MMPRQVKIKAVSITLPPYSTCSTNVIMRPPAITEAICPLTFAPAACISKKLFGSSSLPSLCTMREAIGKAEMPAAPTIGFIFFLENRFRNLAKNTPPHGVKHEADKAENQDEQRIPGHEQLRLHAEGDGEAKQQRYEIGQLVLGALAQAVKHAALADEVPNMRKPMSSALLGATVPAIMVTKIGRADAWSCSHCWASTPCG